uniref:Uncharacterized protein n=1 Tax=Ditylenchus dipsaci TaxID=166011 RepID=A0A915E7I4_9BILA
MGAQLPRLNVMDYFAWPYLQSKACRSLIYFFLTMSMTMLFFMAMFWVCTTFIFSKVILTFYGYGSEIFCSKRPNKKQIHLIGWSITMSNDKEQEDARLVSDDIDSYYSDLMSISGATIDAIGATRQWKPKTTTLIKEGTGVAFLFGKGVRRRLPYPKGSKQYNESSSIYVYEKKLDRLSKDLDRNWKFNINNMLIDQQWKLQVEAPLKNLRMKSNLLTNPDSTKDDVVVNSFRIICKRDSKSDPLTTLDFINKMASMFCELPTAEESRIYRRALNLMSEIRLKHINVSCDENERCAKKFDIRTGIIAHDISLLPEAEATKHFNRIQEDIYHKNFYNYGSALDFLKNC